MQKEMLAPITRRKLNTSGGSITTRITSRKCNKMAQIWQKNETLEGAASRHAQHMEAVRQWCHSQEEKEGLKKTNSH
jgi:hypothetical protein